jgi:hypothetical protein
MLAISWDPENNCIAMVYTFFYPTQPLWNEQTLYVDKRIVKNKRIVKTAGPTIPRYNSCKNLSDYYLSI